MADIQKHLHYLKYKLEMKIECNKILQMIMCFYIFNSICLPPQDQSVLVYHYSFTQETLHESDTDK